jgi:hypothetical protein
MLKDKNMRGVQGMFRLEKIYRDSTAELRFYPSSALLMSYITNDSFNIIV